MHRKTSHSGIFLAFTLLIIAYILSNGVSDKTGMAYNKAGQFDGSIYGFLALAGNHPDEFTLVLGTYAKDYEVFYGQRIADFLTIKAKYEDDIQAESSLLLIGTPKTSLLLDKLMLMPYSKDEAILSVEGKNLFIIVNDGEQAEKLSRVIMDFREKKEKLSPATITFNFSYLVSISVAGIILSAISILVFIEIHRKREISKARESTDEHKLAALENYINKYLNEGHPEEQIRSWLVDYGYNESLVNKAMEGIKNA